MAQHIFRLESDPNSIVNGQPVTIRVFHSLENREEGDSNETGLNFSLHFDEDKLEFESAAVPTGIPGLVGQNPEDDSVSNLDDDPATEKLIRWELNPLGLASGLQFPDEEKEILTVNFNTQNFDDRSTINLVGEGDEFEVIETNLDIVEPSNTSPVANDDTATVGALGDRTVTINVLTNDTDADNDELTIESISNEPDNGTVTINEDRTITYTPNADFTRGEDTFEYQISDGNGGTDTATVTVTVTPRNTSTLKLTGETAQIAYVAYYGRPADNGGRDFWNNVLSENEVSYAPREGDRLTGQEQEIYNQIVDSFGNSEEADRLFGDLNDREKLNRVYQFAFNRDGDE
ncbi:MAG: Ig-like domain-containing protein, partial [Xenococcaceae cyanobacterium]